MLELFQSIFASCQSLASLLHVHLCAQTCGEVFGEVTRCMLGQIDSLRGEHLVSLILHDIHLFAKLDLTTIQAHEHINVKSVNYLVLLSEELLAFQLVSLLILDMPRISINVFLKEVLILQLLFTQPHLKLLLITLILIQSCLFFFFSDAIPFLAADQLFPAGGDRADLGLELADALVID